MAENKPQPKGKDNSSKNGKRGLIVGFIIILLLINGAQLYFNVSQNNTIGEQTITIADQKDTLAAKKATLDSLRTEFDLKLERIKALKMDSTQKAELVQELTEKQEKLEKEVRRAWGSYKKVKSQVDNYAKMLVDMEQDVARAEATSDSLRLIALDLKKTISVKDSSITELENERENLNKTVEEGKALIASKFDISGFNKRGKEKEDENDEFKSKNLEQLQVNFRLMPNPISDVETKTVYFLVQDPSGAVIYNTDKGSGEVEVDGEKMFYTLKQDVLYDRAGKDVTFLFEKGDDYQTGQHAVSIFVGEKKAGETTFVVD